MRKSMWKPKHDEGKRKGQIKESVIQCFFCLFCLLPYQCKNTGNSYNISTETAFTRMVIKIRTCNGDHTNITITRRTGFRVLITFLSRTPCVSVRETVCVCVAVFQFTLFPISSACRIFSLMPWCSSAKNSVFKTIHNVIPSSKSGSLTICYGKHAKKRNRTENENTKANKLNKCILTSFTILSVARSFLSLSSATGYKMSVCLCVCESVSKYVCIFWKLGIL